MVFGGSRFQKLQLYQSYVKDYLNEVQHFLDLKLYETDVISFQALA